MSLKNCVNQLGKIISKDQMLALNAWKAVCCSVAVASLGLAGETVNWAMLVCEGC